MKLILKAHQKVQNLMKIQVSKRWKSTKKSILKLRLRLLNVKKPKNVKEPHQGTKNNQFLSVNIIFNLSYSANYEVTVEQVFEVLQFMFGIKLPNASEKAPENHLDLPDTAALLKMKLGDKLTITSLEDYNELLSDILTEVMMKMAKGKLLISEDSL